jgi:hypothetical protein
MGLTRRLGVPRQINDLIDLRLRNHRLRVSTGTHSSLLRQTLRLEPGTPSPYVVGVTDRLAALPPLVTPLAANNRTRARAEVERLRKCFWGGG